MTNQQNPQHMGGPSLTPDLTESQQKNLAEPRGKPGKMDHKSEDMREKHGEDLENYGTIHQTPDHAVPRNQSST